MTPGLAVFIASGRDEAAWDQSDWRLYRARLTLEYVARSVGGELRLADHTVTTAAASGAASTPSAAPPLITQPVTGWQAARPHVMCEVPDGPVASRIGDLVAPRALLPVVTVTTAATTYRLLNEDSKTIARLLVERPVLGGQRSGPQASPLAPRLSIAEIRGYPGQARRAARLVGAAPGVTAAEVPAFSEALRALGRRPGDYSNKVDTDITAALPASQAAATILLRLLDTIEANVAGVLADTDTEFLHDLRVSVRRTRSALKLFGDALALTEEEVAFFAAEFKWVGDLTTPTRDLDVHLLDFDDTARGLNAAKPDDLEPFRTYLEQRRRREFRALTRGLKSARFTELGNAWRSRLTTIKGSGPAARIGGTTGTLAAERTRAAFAKVARRGAAITAGSPAESLHDLRKRCKELRYALEFFAPLHDRAAQAKVVGELKRLQDCLGEFQDTEVQIGEIRALATAMLAAGEAPAVTLLAMGEVTAGLVSRQRAAREDFARRFAAFAGIDGQRRMSALLRGKSRVGS
jgi:CHAD domain-containing protein